MENYTKNFDISSSKELLWLTLNTMKMIGKVIKLKEKEGLTWLRKVGVTI